MKSKYNYLIIQGLILITILFLSIGYSALNKELSIDSLFLNVEVKEDIRITGISVSDTVNATSYYEKYNVKNISCGVSLPAFNSSVTYLIEVTNYGNIDMGILNILSLPDNFEYEITDYSLKDKLCNSDGECKLGAKSKFYLTIRYKDNKFNSESIDHNFNLLFDFRPFYSVKYQNFDLVGHLPKEVLETDSLVVDFNDNENFAISVKMNDLILTNGANYSYSNSILTIENVLGDIEITKLEGRSRVDVPIKFVSLNNSGYIDDNYLFAGEAYYLNPYNLDADCNSANFAENPKDNPNQCMKWYEISEDDENITLILNSNLGGPIADGGNITNDANSALKKYTDLWDERLLLSDGLLVDNYDYTNHKARMITMDELSYMLENPNWSSENYAVSMEFINKHFAFLFENLNTDTWEEAGYFTSTVQENNKNYAFSKDGLDYSVADSYTYGVRPVIEINKSYLSLDRSWLFNNKDVTYLNTSMISSKSSSTIKNLEYQIKNLRGAGVKKAYLDLGYLELIGESGNIILEDTITTLITENEESIARIIRIGEKYGVEIIPWLNFPMKLDYIKTNYNDNMTWGDYVIQKFKSIIDGILDKGFYCPDDGENYYVYEIHLDAEPMNTRYQSYYLNLVKELDSVIGRRANFTVASPAGDYFSTSYIQSLMKFLNGFNIMIYDTSGPSIENNLNSSRAEYINFIKKTVEHYSEALSYSQTEVYALGGIYKDSYSITSNEKGWPDTSSNKIYYHLNIYNGEELETLNNLVTAAIEINNLGLTGIGFYNWDGFSSYYSSFNKGDYITDKYNYMTIRRAYLKNWAY